MEIYGKLIFFVYPVGKLSFIFFKNSHLSLSKELPYDLHTSGNGVIYLQVNHSKPSILHIDVHVTS